ncbi:hypothetical protein D3261_08955 [Halococcus sp. IIIV-5B]|nr:hypothetical protein D3261_08955 [Halococcus sp. IIIV-5B]
MFMLVLLAIISIILLVQLEQMVGKNLRYSLAAYIMALVSAVFGVYQGSVIHILLAIAVAFLGRIKQSYGLERAFEFVFNVLEKRLSNAKDEDSESPKE